jgi:uncharacterized protein YndB with AHSA1/START domain
MTDRSVAHGTFVIERVYDATPARVFAAFANQESRARWFVAPAPWTSSNHIFDFHVGGREHIESGEPGGPVHTFDAYYQDIVPNERIVFSYDMHIDETRISVSLTTVEMLPESTGTRLIFTEQGAFLNGYDDAGAREHGTGYLLDNLGAELRRATATAWANMPQKESSR